MATKLGAAKLAQALDDGNTNHRNLRSRGVHLREILGRDLAADRTPRSHRRLPHRELELWRPVFGTGLPFRHDAPHPALHDLLPVRRLARSQEVPQRLTERGKTVSCKIRIGDIVSFQNGLWSVSKHYPGTRSVTLVPVRRVGSSGKFIACGKPRVFETATIRQKATLRQSSML